MDNPRTQEKNKALLRRLFERVLHQGDMVIIDQIFSPDFIDHSTPDQPPGPTGVKDYFLEILQGFPNIQVPHHWLVTAYKS
jgi:predicted SnoaL-like aldol condensation-catalyzing enzyme